MERELSVGKGQRNQTSADRHIFNSLSLSNKPSGLRDPLERLRDPLERLRLLSVQSLSHRTGTAFLGLHVGLLQLIW